MGKSRIACTAARHSSDSHTLLWLPGLFGLLQFNDAFCTPRIPVSVQTYVGSVQFSATLAGSVPLIHPLRLLLPPACPPAQFEPAATSQPAGLSVRNAKFPPPKRSLSYQYEHVAPNVGVPSGGIVQVPVDRAGVSTIGIGLLLPSPQLAVAVVVTGVS